MLTKLPELVFFPGIPGTSGSPEVPAVPSRRVCGTPTTTTTAQVCSWVRIWYPDGGGAVVIPPGTQDTREGVENGRPYVECFICRTETSTSTNTGFVTCTTIPGTPAVPAVPAVPGVPARTETRMSFDWNAGANSVQELEDDLQLRFVQAPSIGVIVGLTDDPEAVPAPERIDHGLFFHQTANGAPRVSVYEAGAVMGERSHLPSAEYRIQRLDGAITYWEGSHFIYASRAPSSGPVRAATSIFASGDSVPTAVVEVPE